MSVSGMSQFRIPTLRVCFSSFHLNAKLTFGLEPWKVAVMSGFWAVAVAANTTTASNAADWARVRGMARRRNRVNIYGPLAEGRGGTTCREPGTGTGPRHLI